MGGQNEDQMIVVVAIAPLAWLLGTFPSALLVARAHGRDVTTEGSGNPGATNVTRLLGWRAGAVVLLCDFAKGAIAAGVGLLVGGRPGAYVLGVAAILGHTFPLYRKGGKGVATAAGVHRARSRCSDEATLVQAELAGAVEKHGDLLRDIKSWKADVDALVKRADDYRRLKAAVHSVATRWDRAIQGSKQLSALLAWLQEDLARTQQSVKESDVNVAAIEADLQELRNARGSFPQHLAEACETIDGRLLVERFEDVPFASLARSRDTRLRRLDQLAS